MKNVQKSLKSITTMAAKTKMADIMRWKQMPWNWGAHFVKQLDIWHILEAMKCSYVVVNRLIGRFLSSVSFSNIGTVIEIQDGCQNSRWPNSYEILEVYINEHKWTFCFLFECSMAISYRDITFNVEKIAFFHQNCLDSVGQKLYINV